MSTLDTAVEPVPASLATRTEAKSRAASFAWTAVVVACCLLTAIVATWPLVADIWTAVPMGTEPQPTVQLFSIWTLWWTAERVAHGLAGYWDAPIFYPNAGVFTYSEPEPLLGLAVAPLWGLGATPAMLQNFALLGVLTLNGIFGYRLARALTIARGTALLAALLTITLPFVAKEYGVVNLTPIFGILWTLDGLVRFGKSGEIQDGIWAASGIVTAFLTCQQYALMFAPFAFAAGLLALAEQRFKVAAILRLAVPGLLAGGIVLLVAWPAITLHRELGLTRPDFVVQALSAEPFDFMTRPGTALVGILPRVWDDTAGLFPGILLLWLAVAGIVFGWRDAALRRWTVFLVVTAGLCVVFALGLNLKVAGWSPFAVLRSIAPGFDEMRTPFRFALIMQAVLPLLGAMTLAQAATLLGRWGIAVATAIALLAAGENLNIPNPTMYVPPRPSTAWTEWLRSQPADTVVAHVPFPGGLSVADYGIETWRMFAQMDHEKVMINGFSSYFPPGYTDFQIDMAKRFPEKDLLCELSAGLSVNTVVADRVWLETVKPKMENFADFLVPVYEDSQVQIYRLQAAPGACVPSAPTP